MNEDGTTEAGNRGLREHTQALEAINRQLHEHIGRLSGHVAQLTTALRDGARRETALNERIYYLESGWSEARAMTLPELLRLALKKAENHGLGFGDEDDEEDGENPLKHAYAEAVTPQPLKIADIKLGQTVDVRSPECTGRGTVHCISQSLTRIDDCFVTLSVAGTPITCRPEHLFAVPAGVAGL